MLIVDGPLADHLSEVVRGTCNVPVVVPDCTKCYQDPAAPTALVREAVSQHPSKPACRPIARRRTGSTQLTRYGEEP